jgi:hypothetical protein
MPSVFGYTSDAAVAMLEARGLAVTRISIGNECGETFDRVTAADPAPGQVVEPGQTVKLFVVSHGGFDSAYCVLDTFHRDDAWALLDYANARGARPRTAPGLDLDPLVQRLREWSAEVGRFENGRHGQSHLRWPTPRLTTSRATAHECAAFADQIQYADVLALSVQLSTGLVDGALPHRSCRTVLVAFDRSGTIVDIATGDDVAQPLDRQVPADVVGNTVEYATERLEAQGLHVEAVGRADCQPEGFVTAQQPDPGQDVEVGTTVVLDYTTQRGTCVSSLQSRVPTSE